MYHKGNPPSEGCQDSGDPDLPVPPMRERTESVREPAVPLQRPGVLEPKGRSPEAPKEPMGRAYGERVRLGDGRGGMGSPWGGPEAASLPRVAETLGPAEGGDVLGVSGGGRTRRSGRPASATGRRPEAYRGGLRPTHPSGDKPSGQRAPIERWHPTVRQGWARYGGKPCVSASRWLSMRR
jgi:hypothetical protein